MPRGADQGQTPGADQAFPSWAAPGGQSRQSPPPSGVPPYASSPAFAAASGRGQAPPPGYPSQPGYPPQPGPSPSAGPLGGYPPAGTREGDWLTRAAGPAPSRLAGPVTTALMLVATLASLGYAAWAFTQRRSIFSDFSNGTTVSIDDAESSDRLDTIFLAVAGVLVAAALVMWVLRWLQGRGRGGPLELTGLGVAILGILTVALGLVLASQVTDAATQSAQGDRGVIATAVTGAGFIALAVSLVIGAFCAGGAGNDPASSWDNDRTSGDYGWPGR